MQALSDYNQFRDGKLSVHVLHFNHGLRPEEAVAEQRLVEQLARSLGFPYHLRIRTREMWPSDGSGIQEQARKWRREEAEDLRSALGAQAIVLAHHADDQQVIYRATPLLSKRHLICEMMVA